MLKPSAGKSLQISRCLWGGQKIVLDTLLRGTAKRHSRACSAELILAFNTTHLFDKS
ncbi:hypothetical protein PS907_02274 [Pseudomonas fluorescens]|jgi:hypothetical protein|nr:hypothetical protein PS907_02274 [Pseudomonas fluorescens]